MLSKFSLPVFEARKRGIHYSDLNIPNSCSNPFQRVTIGTDGECYICNCDAYLPISVGNICDFTNLLDIWTNPTALHLQNDIKNKKFTYCAVDHCGIRAGNVNEFNDCYYVSINIDPSCNLACPSCRPEMVNYTSGPEFDRITKIVDNLIKLIENFDRPLFINMCGNGDVLASSIMRPLILNWAPREYQYINIQTNGLLMKKLLPSSKIFPSIKNFQISVDAGTKEVYEQVRRPGKFDLLLENLTWLKDNLPSESNVILHFCLYDTNAGDIVNFANLCKHFGFAGEIGRLEDWYSFADFNSRDAIGNKTHPMHNTALEQLHKVRTYPNIQIRDTLIKIMQNDPR